MKNFTSGLTTLWGREPVAIIGLLEAALLMLAYFGLELSAGQITALMTFAAALLTVITRQSVVSPKTHVEEVNNALNQEPPAAENLVTEEAAL